MKNFVAIFLLIFSFSVFAGPNKFKEVDLRIMNYLYNADLVQADSLLNLQINQEPENPKYPLMKAHYHFYSRYFTPGLDRDSIMQLTKILSWFRLWIFEPGIYNATGILGWILGSP